MKFIEICHHLFLDKSPTNNIFNIVSYKQVPNIMEISFFQHRMEISFFQPMEIIQNKSPIVWNPSVASQLVAGSAVLAGGLPRSAQQLHYINGMGHRCESGESSQHTGQWEVTIGNNNVVYLRMGYNNGR